MSIMPILLASGGVVTYVISTNTADLLINVNSLPGYSPGAKINIIVSSGIYVYSTNTANAALTITGGTSSDSVTIINNGYIMGKGGQGGGVANSNYSSTVVPATTGGNAISVSVNVTIDNTNTNAYIGGGGGGGGHLILSYKGTVPVYSGSGGAGGGESGNANTSLAFVSKYSGGTIGLKGTDSSNTYVGASGGRIFPATNITIGNTVTYTTTTVSSSSLALGGEGGGSGSYSISAYGNPGSVTASTTGGGSSNTGNTYFAISGTAYGQVTGAGGGWGASGASANGRPIIGTYTLGTGAAGGKAVSLNGKTITWKSGDTSRVYGAVS